jgi:hypothetical protein
MCRLAQAAKELFPLGGKLQLLCSRRDDHMEYCPHHPAIAGVHSCGYQRQQSLEMRNKTRVWVIPASMLATAPPVALKRAKHGLEGDFDLLVIDEAPWFNLLPAEQAKVPVEWFVPEWWAAQDSRASDAQKDRAAETLARLHTTLTRLPLGEVSADEFASAGISASDLWLTRRTVWKFKRDLRDLVTPGSKPHRLRARQEINAQFCGQVFGEMV